MTTKTTVKAQLTRWQQPGATGFLAFVEDVRPMIPSEAGGFQPYVIPSEDVRSAIVEALDGDFSTIVFCWPRRHGKTVISALIIVWRFVTRRNQTIALVANSTNQTVDTAFRLVRTIIERTPYTKTLIESGALRVLSDAIHYEAVGSSIQGFSSNVAALFGKKLSIAQVSELHAARTDEVFQALASSTIDSSDGLVLVDSTVGPRSSPLYGLFNLWQTKADPALYFSHLFYSNLEDAVARGPRWISEKKLRSRAAQMLPAVFAQQHLNQWTNASNALFPPEVIDSSRKPYPLDVEALADRRPFAVGGGLDRAYGFSLHGDQTVASAVLKVLDGEEEHIYVLASESIAFSSASGIKRAFSRFHREFGLKKAAIESYNSQDIAAWCADQLFEHEVAFATAERQSNIFTALYNAAAEGRLHIHPRFEKLLSEMETFEYRLEVGAKGTIAKFEHAKNAHDDHVYSLAWALYALRDIELNPYELDGIHCNAAGPIARLCILNDGDLVPNCADTCRSFQKLSNLYAAYRNRAGIAPMEIDHFFKSKVTNIGTHTVKR
jgi:hypothetical protein